MAVNREGSGVQSKLPMALILSNQDNAAFAAGGAQTKENHLAAVSFGWTNGSVIEPSVRLTPVLNLTN